MSYKQSSKRIISQSVLWAVAMLSSGLLLGESDQYFFYILLLVVLATVSIAMDPGHKEVLRVERRYVCRLLGIGQNRENS